MAALDSSSSEQSARLRSTRGGGGGGELGKRGNAPAADAAAAPAQPASPRGEQQRACRMPGCCEPLKAGYMCKYRICAVHYSAPCLILDGEAQRFCQQCGQVHLLCAFDEDRRSCRDSLRRHQDCRLARKRRARQPAQQAQREVAAPARGAAAPKAAAVPKAAAAKAAAAGETPKDAVPKAAAGEVIKAAKRKRQASGPGTGTHVPSPRKQQKKQQPQQQDEAGQKQQQATARPGKQGLPAAKRKQSEALNSSDGSTQEHADICHEEPSLPMPLPKHPRMAQPQPAAQEAAQPRAAPSSQGATRKPAAAAQPAVLLPQMLCALPAPPAGMTAGAPADVPAEELPATVEPEADAAQAGQAPAVPLPPPRLPLEQHVPASPREPAPAPLPVAEWQVLASHMERQVPPAEPQREQRAPAPQPQPLLVRRALQLLETPVSGLPDVPSLDELIALSGRMGFDLQPCSPTPAQGRQPATWLTPQLQALLQPGCSAAAAAAALPASATALKGSRVEQPTPASTLLGAALGPETPTSAELAARQITLMQRREGSADAAPALHIYEVTRSSQRCCWQLSCEYSSSAAAAHCH
ncbi:hypothetical protein ABPG75_001611 [Micractinium tetrahymenae]